VPLGEEIPLERGHKRGVPPLRNRYLTTSGSLAWKRLQIDTDLLLIITSTADELSSGTNIDDLEWPWTPKWGFTVNFQRFLTAIHILRLNCAETVPDRPGQPAYEMFGIKRRFQRCKVWPPGFKESSVRAHQIWVPLRKVRFLLLSTNLAREWLQIGTDLLLITTSTADELSVGTNIDDLERPWTPKIGVLSDFFSDFGLQYTF